MAKFKTGLVKGYREEQEKERAEQAQQKAKKVAYKIAVSPFSGLVRKAATIILLILATIGLLALLHPETRSTIIGILKTYFEQIKTLLGV